MTCCPRGCGNVTGDERTVLDEQGYVEWSYWMLICVVCKLKWYSL